MKELDKGSKLICLDDNFPAWAKVAYTHLPVKDKIYTLRHIGMGLDVKETVPIGSINDKEKSSDPPNIDGKWKSRTPFNFKGVGTVMVLLEELHNPIHDGTKLEMGYRLDRFGPIDEVSEQNKISETMKEPHKPIIVKPRKDKKLVTA